MGVIGEILPFAVAIAVSPLPVIVVVLILVSDNARASGSAYVGGRLLGITAIVAVVAVLFSTGAADLSIREHPSTATSIGRIVVGALLAGLAVRTWFQRPKPGEDPTPSRLLRRVDRTTPPRAFVLGVLVAVLDVGTALLAMMAGVDIGHARLPLGQAVAVGTLFVLVASVSATGPLLARLSGGEAVQGKLVSAKVWLLANEKPVLMVLFLIVAAVMIGRGITELAP
ncbi:GAP family protein [Nocardia sp. IBHARD005]|uniref:GAP family protein n=1 Tax=Nocardia sp. IBHARD005 TaxID=3457765 RepID=UPI0040599D88